MHPLRRCRGRQSSHLHEFKALEGLPHAPSGGDHPGAAGQEAVYGGAAQSLGASTNEYALASATRSDRPDGSCHDLQGHNHSAVEIEPVGEAYCAALEVAVNAALTLDEVSLVRTSRPASAGLILAMESEVRDDVEAGRLVPMIEDWTPTLSPLSLCYPSRRNSTTAFKAFIDYARRNRGAGHS